MPSEIPMVVHPLNVVILICSHFARLHREMCFRLKKKRLKKFCACMRYVGLVFLFICLFFASVVVEEPLTVVDSLRISPFDCSLPRWLTQIHGEYNMQ